MPDAETNTADTNLDYDDGDYLNRLETLIPWKPIIDDDTAMIAAHALIELVAQRTPHALGDSLAELHALTSLLHQLHDWVTPTIADAIEQQHTPGHIFAQLAAKPSRPGTPTFTPATEEPPQDHLGTNDPPRRSHVYNGETLSPQRFPREHSK